MSMRSSQCHMRFPSKGKAEMVRVGNSRCHAPLRGPSHGRTRSLSATAWPAPLLCALTTLDPTTEKG